MSDYTEKFKDPRWQKKRLEILQRDGWKCVCCKAETKQLHAHHTYYVPGRDPWEYPDWCYSTLCEQCHDFEHDNLGKKAAAGGGIAHENWELLVNELPKSSARDDTLALAFAICTLKDDLQVDSQVAFRLVIDAISSISKEDVERVKQLHPGSSDAK